MTRFGVSLAVGIAALSVLVAACGRNKQSEAPAAPAESIKSIMRSEVDPSGTFLFQSIMEISDYRGVTRKAPATAKDWAEVTQHLQVLHDAPAKLSVPGIKAAGPRDRAANPLLENQPREIQKLLDTQHDDFVRRASRLREAADQGLKAAAAKDKDALFLALTQIDRACEGCHVHYWYPKDQRAVRAAREAGLMD